MIPNELTLAERGFLKIFDRYRGPDDVTIGFGHLVSFENMKAAFFDHLRERGIDEFEFNSSSFSDVSVGTLTSEKKG